MLAALLMPTAIVMGLYVSRIRFSKRIVAQTRPDQSAPERCRRTIVIAGDSTAFGVGALPGESTAGRLAAAYPFARVINVSRCGARIGHVVDQLAKLDIASADVVLIHACGNDVLEFRPVEKVDADLRAAIASARKLSPNVILMPGHNFSIAPFFLRPLSRIVTWHAARVHAVVKRVTQELSVTFVDLFREPHDDPFVKEPARYYCPDRLHPSGEGYAVWFAALIAQVPFARFLADAGSD
ncbi:MAG: SGNH/GDSL hydrolase family protein [Pseudomonadota bacterium]|nr:SGNH/GDSL hydrolase family protein [Pseudomonadota bacterium]